MTIYGLTSDQRAEIESTARRIRDERTGITPNTPLSTITFDPSGRAIAGSAGATVAGAYIKRLILGQTVGVLGRPTIEGTDDNASGNYQYMETPVRGIQPLTPGIYQIELGVGFSHAEFGARAIGVCVVAAPHLTTPRYVEQTGAILSGSGELSPSGAYWIATSVRLRMTQTDIDGGKYIAPYTVSSGSVFTAIVTDTIGERSFFSVHKIGT